MNRRVDDFILECWAVDDTGWSFEVSSDPWVEVKAKSEALGNFRFVSPGPFSMEPELDGLMNQIKQAKRERESHES